MSTVTVMLMRTVFGQASVQHGGSPSVDIAQRSKDYMNKWAHRRNEQARYHIEVRTVNS